MSSCPAEDCDPTEGGTLSPEQHYGGFSPSTSCTTRHPLPLMLGLSSGPAPPAQPGTLSPLSWAAPPKGADQSWHLDAIAEVKERVPPARAGAAQRGTGSAGSTFSRHRRRPPAAATTQTDQFDPLLLTFRANPSWRLD